RFQSYKRRATITACPCLPQAVDKLLTLCSPGLRSSGTPAGSRQGHKRKPNGCCPATGSSPVAPICKRRATPGLASQASTHRRRPPRPLRRLPMLAEIGPAASRHDDDKAKEARYQGAFHEPGCEPESIVVWRDVLPSVVSDIGRKDQPM